MASNKRRLRKELIQELEKNYLLQPACSKLGLTRSAVYRWMKQDQEFGKAVRDSQLIGRRYMSDYTETKLFKNIERQDERAIEYWLKNNNERYKSLDITSSKIIASLKQQLSESQAALSAVGKNNIFSNFVDHDKMMRYIESPEAKEIEMLMSGIHKESSPHQKEVMDQARKVIMQIELARYAKEEGLLPEESNEIAD
jgi:hypothetical protein